MSMISVGDLKKRTTKRWWQSAGQDDVIVTAAGQPVAVLLRTDAASLEPTLATLRSVRAVQAQAALQQAAAANGSDQLTASDIDAEIAASRRARRGR
jgi:hypothetical protein